MRFSATHDLEDARETWVVLELGLSRRADPRSASSAGHRAIDDRAPEGHGAVSNVRERVEQAVRNSSKPSSGAEVNDNRNRIYAGMEYGPDLEQAGQL